MKIDQGIFVSVQYKLYIDNAEGQLVEETTQEEPFEFIFGQTPLLPDFEVNLNGKSAGETVEFQIPAERAYGEYDENHTAELAKSMFLVDGEVDDDLFEEGALVPLKDDQGNEILAEVYEVHTNHICVDLNHPLAGENLFFSINIEEVRTPSEKEESSL
ncbi:MAG: FKBP-type peptidyl-prolyl cis-trans isomerase [Flavobacteriales bacterium]|nr:FKBP-type peptidyl-prolyl cis-trans isomerase [Flavobacteriales bacterium]